MGYIPGWQVLVWVIAVLTTCGVMAKDLYIMDNHIDCGYIGVHDIQRDQTITVNAKSTDSTRSTQGGCTMNFRALDADAHIQLDFSSFFISDCGVTLSLSGDGSATMKTYSCAQGSNDPHSYYSLARTITVTLSKNDANSMDYNFLLKIKAVRELQYPPPGDSNPAATGMVIGVAGGVISIIVIVVCVGVCCFRKYRTHGTTKSPYLFDSNSKSNEPSHTSVGYTNESLRDGVRGSPASKKKLLAHSDSSSDEKADNSRNRPNTLNLRNTNAGHMNNRSNAPVAPPLPEFANYSKSNMVDERPERDRDRNAFDFNERSTNKYREQSVDTNGKGGMLNALHSNPKFRNSFSENEIDAEKRAKRISSSSIEKAAPWPQLSDESKHPPKLPPVPRSPKSPKSKHARIKRTPRPTSQTSEELAQIERGRMDSDDDPDIRVVKDEAVSSSSDIVSINVNRNVTDEKKKANTAHSLKPDRKGPRDRKKQQSVSTGIDPEPTHDASSTSDIGSRKGNANIPDDKKKANTAHSLKPDRKGPHDRKKQTQSVSSAIDYENVNDESTSSSSDIGPRNASDDKKKHNTIHSLKPDRKGGHGRKKQTQSVFSALDPEPKHLTQRDRVASTDGVLNESFETQGSGRYSKRPSKSPKSRIRGFGHRRGRREDQSDSRPTTPTSAFGSREDLESLPPLGRAGSKSSLYSSRTSLYDRRGNRRRKGSYPDSIASSTRDDISVMRHSRDYNDYYDEYFDGYEKPLSRRDKERMFRSDTDIGRTVSTQTLRETATQTGPDETAVISQRKVVIKKKRRPRSMSSSGTQTANKKAAAGDKTKEQNSPKSKTKRSKSVNVTDDIKRSKSVEELDTKTREKPSKPKLKPKPRKSTSADSILDDRDKSASKENLAENPYYPKSEGFAVEGYPGQPYPGYPGYPNAPPVGYPGVPGAGYPGVQYLGQPGMQYQPPNMPGVVPAYGQNMYPQPPMTTTNVLPPNQPPAEPRKPRKSNWEMLVELTDGEYQGRNRDDITETGSVASSVFTNNPQSMPGYGAPAGQQAYYAPQAGNQPQQTGYEHQQFGYQPPQTGYQPQQTGNLPQQMGYQPPQTGYQPPQEFVQPSQKEPQAQRAATASPSRREEAINKKSSWDALEEITRPQGQVNINGNTKTETVI